MANLHFVLAGCGRGSSSTPSPSPGDGYSGTDDQLLEEISKATFQFFWEQTDAATGQIKDRAFAAGGNDNRPVSSISSTGFGLTALCIGDQRGYQPTSTIINRVQTTLSFLLNQMQPQGMNGFFYHFVGYDFGGTRVHLRSIVDRHGHFVVRGVDLPAALFARHPNSRASDANLQSREFQLDTERRNNTVDGLDTRERVSFDSLGYLF